MYGNHFSLLFKTHSMLTFGRHREAPRSVFYYSNIVLMATILLLTICPQEWDFPGKIFILTSFQLLTLLTTTNIYHPTISNLAFELLCYDLHLLSFPAFLQLPYFHQLALHKFLSSFIEQILAECQVLCWMMPLQHEVRFRLLMVSE